MHLNGAGNFILNNFLDGMIFVVIIANLSGVDIKMHCNVNKNMLISVPDGARVFLNRHTDWEFHLDDISFWWLYLRSNVKECELTKHQSACEWQNAPDNTASMTGANI